MMILSDAQAFSLSLSLGLMISVWSTKLGCEIGRTIPIGGDDSALPDLRILSDGTRDASRVEALSPNGQAFLDLMAEV